MCPWLLGSHSLWNLLFYQDSSGHRNLSQWKWVIKHWRWTAERRSVWHSVCAGGLGHTVRCHSCKMLGYCPCPPRFLWLEELGCWPWRSQETGCICRSSCVGTFSDFRAENVTHISSFPVSNGAQHGREFLFLCCFPYNFTKGQAMARDGFKWFVTLYLWIVAEGRGKKRRWQTWEHKFSPEFSWLSSWEHLDQLLKIQS